MHRRLVDASRRPRGRAAPDHHPHPPGLRDGADEAVPRRDHRLVADARVHLADRPGRVPDRRRDRAVHDLQAESGRFPFLEYSARHALELFPQLEQAKILRSWTGLCDLSPDYSPILGSTEVEGFLVSCGWGTYGFKAAPIVGTTLAEQIATEQTPELIAPFALERFYTRHGSSPSSPPRQSATRQEEPHWPRRCRPASRSPRRLSFARSPEIAEALGLSEDEYDPYGRYKAKVSLSVLDRLERPARRQAHRRHGDHAHEGGRGQDDDLGLADAGARAHRQEPRALPARGVARPGVRDQGRRGRRRLRAGRPDGGHEPPLHGRHPRDRRGEQPPRRAARGAPAAREQARDRPALGHAGGAASTSTTAPFGSIVVGPRRAGERLRPRDRASTSLPHPRSWRSSRSRATSSTSASGSGRSPSATPGKASRSRPSSSRPRARWPSCSRTRSSRTSSRRSKGSPRSSTAARSQTSRTATTPSSRRARGSSSATTP